MANFILTCIDRAGAAELRTANRPAHLAFLSAHPAVVKLAGPLLDAAGAVIGSLLVLEAESADDITTFAAADPYALAGLFERTDIQAWKVTVGALA